jgi:hypothetical protein
MEMQQRINRYSMDEIISKMNATMEDALGRAGWDIVKYMIMHRYKVDPDTSDIIVKRDMFRAAITAMLGTRVLEIVDEVLPKGIHSFDVEGKHIEYLVEWK